MEFKGKAEQIKTNMFAGLKIVTELQLKIVESAVSLKMSEIATKAMAQKKIGKWKSCLALDVTEWHSYGRSCYGW